MTRIRTSIEAQVAAETLGYAGLRLRRALDALHLRDANAASARSQRPALVAEAGEAFWRFVVQRELLGLRDPELVAEIYNVPAEIWQSMGPRRSESHEP